MVQDTVDRVAGRFGIPSQAVAILMIVFGVLIIVLPQLLPWLIGILLIVLGVLWLVGASGATAKWAPRAREPAGPPPRV